MKPQPRLLALAAIDRRFAALRLISPADLRRLRASIEREGIRHPVLVSSAVEADCSVLLDGFKRVRVAQELEFGSVWAQVVAFDAAQSKAAMLHANQAQRGLSDVEEAWIVRALCREHGMRQVAVGQLLGRDKSWVCRRLKLAEALEATLQEDLRLGLLSASAARELARLPRGNQLLAGAAVRDHQLTSRQAARLVERLQQSDDPAARREVLADPLRFIGTDKSDVSPVADPRLSERGNQLRRLLLSWDGVSSHVVRSLSRHVPVGLAAEEARVLGPIVHRALGSGRRATEQLEAIERESGAGDG
jgi:ParB-like chromosome segregation protein Spo0J